jgi:uroporphyrinogen decarboxylase
MTNRERFVNCVLGKKIDRVPFIYYFGPWGETILRWRNEGAPDDNAWIEGKKYDCGIQTISSYINSGYFPVFNQDVISENENIITLQDMWGNYNECIKSHSTIPHTIKFAAHDRDSWEKIKKERLNPDSPGRYCDNFYNIIENMKKTDAPVQLGIYPYGVFGTAREVLGVENILFAFYDEPDLLKDIMNTFTDLWISIFENVCKYIKADIIHIWEDMSGKQGSLISPEMVEEFMLPNYRKIKAFADKNDIPVICVDTDGNCEELIPLFSSAGVNLMLPFEVSAGCDIIKLHEKYPKMAIMGGIDKLEIAKGKSAIDAELNRIKPLLSESRYIPALDHLISPEISYPDYCYFINKLREMIYQSF